MWLGLGSELVELMRDTSIARLESWHLTLATFVWSLQERFCGFQKIVGLHVPRRTLCVFGKCRRYSRKYEQRSLGDRSWLYPKDTKDLSNQALSVGNGTARIRDMVTSWVLLAVFMSGQTSAVRTMNFSENVYNNNKVFIKYWHKRLTQWFYE